MLFASHWQNDNTGSSSRDGRICLIGRVDKRREQKPGLGDRGLSEADGLLGTQLAHECARGKEVLLTTIKSWLIFLHHFCTPSCRFLKRNRMKFLICHRKTLKLRQQSYRINTVLSFPQLSLVPENIFKKIASEWGFYIIMVEFCIIKLLILSLPVGQSALINKSGILFNITLKRCKGINTNLCQIHCSKKI